jgi:hypothetical protein
MASLIKKNIGSCIKRGDTQSLLIGKSEVVMHAILCLCALHLGPYIIDVHILLLHNSGPPRVVAIHYHPTVRSTIGSMKFPTESTKSNRMKMSFACHHM